MTLFLQAVASLIAIITFLIVLNVQRQMLLPAGVLGMGVWLIYYVLRQPTNAIIATFVAAVLGACFSQLLSIRYKTPAVVFMLAVLAPLVPGYLSYRTTASVVIGQYREAAVQATSVILLALVVSIGMASGTVVLKLYRLYLKHKKG